MKRRKQEEIYFLIDLRTVASLVGGGGVAASVRRL
jgi:hypothetical protein